jgi:hypothetical protein
MTLATANATTRIPQPQFTDDALFQVVNLQSNRRRPGSFGNINQSQNLFIWNLARGFNKYRSQICRTLINRRLQFGLQGVGRALLGV